MTQILIGLTARAGRGKNTLGDMLAEMIPGAKCVAFADAMKDDVLEMVEHQSGFVFSRENLEQHKATIFGGILQGYGELLRRFRGDDYWINRLEAVLPDVAIVTDVRYHNEAAWISSRGGLVVSLVGPSRRIGDTRDPNHPSEANVDEVSRRFAHLEVPNTGSLDDLRREAEGIARIANNLLAA